MVRTFLGGSVYLDSNSYFYIFCLPSPYYVPVQHMLYTQQPGSYSIVFHEE